MSKDDNFGVFKKLIEKAKNFNNKKIVLPEGSDDRVIGAANKLAEDKICKIIIIGDSEVIEPKLSKKAKSSIEIVNPNTFEKQSEYVNALYELRKHKGIDLAAAKKLLLNNIYLGTMMVKMGYADGMVAGSITHTADVLRPAFQIIKTKPGISKASSCLIIESPDNKKFGQNGFLVLSDCAVNEKPSAEDLSDIALSSSETARQICSISPRVAMLSYSTKSTLKNDDLSEDIIKVKQACEILKSKNPNFEFDGELQVDTALLPSVAQIKSKGGKIMGNANVLVFPDLNAGNIAYKLACILGNLKAVGPIVQGLNMPINDLSRSSTQSEIYLTVALTVLQTIN